MDGEMLANYIYSKRYECMFACMYAYVCIIGW